MKRHLFILILIFWTSITFAQEIRVYKTPFKSGVVKAAYKDSTSKYRSVIHIGNYGEKLSAEIEGKIDGKDTHIRLIILEGFNYSLDFKKEEVTKMPQNGNSNDYSPIDMEPIGTLDYLERNCTKYSTIDSATNAVFYDSLLMQLTIPATGVEYRVTEINENENLPVNIFDIPKGFSMREFNWNFED